MNDDWYRKRERNRNRNKNKDTTGNTQGMVMEVVRIGMLEIQR